MNRIVVYLAFIVISLGGGLLIGLSNLPDAWYQSLAKPWFTPPNWLFGPAWSLLYVLIGIAGASTWTRGRADGAMIAWVAQMALNFLWSPAFFRLKSPDLALAIILPLLVLIIVFIAISWRRDRLTSSLFIPYALWVGYASALNTAIVALNWRHPSLQISGLSSRKNRLSSCVNDRLKRN